MANLISYQNGNFTAANWKTVETTSLQSAWSASTATTTSYVYNATGFTPSNGTVLEGVLMHVRQNLTSGTVSIALLGSGSGTPVKEVTVNTTDIPTGVSGGSGGTYGSWVFFKFDSTYTCDGAQNYKIGVKSNATNNVYFHRDGTTANWARVFRTSTTASPAASDILWVSGENTGQGTSNSISLTMDSTAATAYGNTNICNLGTLSYDTSASTNYYLKLAGLLQIWRGGTLNIGTVGTPIPSASTAVLEFASTSQGLYGLENRGGTFNTYGNIGTKVVSAKLTADVIGGGTTLTTDITTNWVSGDVIGIASTTRTYTQAESKTVSSSTGTSVTIPALTNAHSGTSPCQAEVIYLNRNIKIRGLGVSGATNTGYVYFDLNATSNCNYTEFYWLGYGTTLKYGVLTDSGVSTVLTYCAMHDFGSGSTYPFTTNTGAVNHVTVNYCVTYNTTWGFSIAATTGTDLSFDHNIIMYGTGATQAFNINDGAVNVTNMTITSCSNYGFYFSEAASYTGTLSNLVSHSNASYGIYLYGNTTNVTLSNLTVVRNNNVGIYINSDTKDCSINNSTIVQNVTSQLYLYNSILTNFILSNSTMYADTTYTATYGIQLDSLTLLNSKFVNCSFSGHTTYDLYFAGTCLTDLLLDDVLLNSSTPIYGMNLSFQRETSKIRFNRYQQQLGNNQTWFTYGTIKQDDAFYKTTPAERLSPTGLATTNRMNLESSPKRVALLEGTNTTVGVWVRTSLAADGAAYNGSRARLMLRANPGATGLSSDTVLATASTASDGTWEQLTALTPVISEDGILEFFVDCDGTIGWITVDDWTIT